MPNKSFDELIKERAYNEAKVELHPWLKELERVLLAGKLFALPQGQQIGFARFHNQCTIQLRGEKSAGAPKLDLPVAAVIEALFNAAVDRRAEQLVVKHQQQLLQHYDELVKPLESPSQPE
jgi:hypothetical protein